MEKITAGQIMEFYRMESCMDSPKVYIRNTRSGRMIY